MANGLTIGVVANRVGMRSSAVRFYERQGLVASRRLANGYRIYDGEALKALRFIGRAKALGFSLTEIGEILEVRRNGGEPCGCVKALIDRKSASNRYENQRSFSSAASTPDSCTTSGQRNPFARDLSDH
jgi:DNA-binding transcriptional MerR regulator